MKSKRNLFVGAAVLIGALVAGGVAYGLLGNDTSQGTATTREVPTRSSAPARPTPAKSSSSGSATATASHSPAASPTGSAIGALTPEEAVVKLVTARAAGSRADAEAVAVDQAAAQIFSYPAFNIRESGVACNRSGAEATCTVSSEAADLSMILKVGQEPSGAWRVRQIEPVID